MSRHEDEVGGSTVLVEGVVGGIRGPGGGCRASSMTMAESAVEDAAAAPPGPAKPPPPSCTNNNTLAATANRNHRNPRKKRRRLEQVVDTLQAHRSSPSEGEVLKFEGSAPASEEEDVFGSPRSSSSRSAADTTSMIGQLAVRLKDVESITSTEEDPLNESGAQHHHHQPHRSYRYSYHPHHHRHRYSPYQNNHRLPKYPDCVCAQCSSQSLTSMMLPSATSLQTPLSRPGFSSYSSICGAYSSIFEQYMNSKYLSSSDTFRGRSHSDSDVVPRWGDDRLPGSSTSSSSVVVGHPPRSGSLESDGTSPQESPLDLSMKNLMQSAAAAAAAAAAVSARSPALQLLPPGIVTRGSVSVPVVRGDVASPTTKETVAVRYNLEVLPVVEEMAPGADVAYVCPECGQMFSLHDRLAKHMASRHRRQGLHDASAKAYLCDVCQRSFARSDMLTRHMRLHTGVKPYTCRVCRQVFSRSDHLSTHQRTHTGEKPYKCPQCAYAACRRDMITRHLKTHNRCAEGPTPKTEPGLLAAEECPTFGQNMAAPSAIIKAE